MEIRKNTLTDGEALFAFFEGLKQAVRHYDSVNRQATLADVKFDAERIDSTIYLSIGKGRDKIGPLPMDFVL